MKKVGVLLLLLMLLLWDCGGSGSKDPDFDILWDYNNPAATETAFRDFLKEHRSGMSPEGVLSLQTQIARTLGLQQRFKEAHQFLDSVQVHLGDAPSVPLVRYQLERGRTYNSAGDQETALALFRDALGNALLINADFYAVDAAHMMAIASPARERLDWNLRALALTETSADPRAHKWLGSLYNNIGWTYHEQGQYRKALNMFEKALAFREEQEDVENIFIARWAIARTYRSLGIFDEALKIQREIKAEREERKLEPDGYVAEEIAENLYAMGQPNAAKPHFREAYQLLKEDKWLAGSEPERLERLQLLGE